MIEIVVDHPRLIRDDQFATLRNRVGGLVAHNDRTERLEFVIRRHNQDPMIAVQSGMDQVAQAYREAFGDPIAFVRMTAAPVKGPSK